MTDVKKATSDIKKLDIGKDSGSDASKPKSPTTPKSLSPTSPTTPKTPTTPTTPTSPGAPGAGAGGVSRNPSAIKEAILNWCKAMCEGYEHVNITNFSSSWADGMAFCALIHHFYPNAFDYSKLNPKNRRGNFKLAFDVADKLAGIAPLLEVEDMIRMKNNPDWKCVFTYVQSIYRHFVTLQKQAKKDEGEKKDETKAETQPADNAEKKTDEDKSDKTEETKAE